MSSIFRMRGSKILSLISDMTFHHPDSDCCATYRSLNNSSVRFIWKIGKVDALQISKLIFRGIEECSGRFVVKTFDKYRRIILKQIIGMN